MSKKKQNNLQPQKNSDQQQLLKKRNNLQRKKIDTNTNKINLYRFIVTLKEMGEALDTFSNTDYKNKLVNDFFENIKNIPNEKLITIKFPTKTYNNLITLLKSYNEAYKKQKVNLEIELDELPNNVSKENVNTILLSEKEISEELKKMEQNIDTDEEMQNPKNNFNEFTNAFFNIISEDTYKQIYETLKNSDQDLHELHEKLVDKYKEDNTTENLNYYQKVPESNNQEGCFNSLSNFIASFFPKKDTFNTEIDSDSDSEIEKTSTPNPSFR